MSANTTTNTEQSNGLLSFIIDPFGMSKLVLSDLIALLARFAIGMVFWLSGQTKVDGWSIKDTTFLLFENEYNLPIIPHVPAAYMATIAEHIFPILIWIGLATRLSALSLLIMTIVIQTFVYPNAYVTHGLWAVALLFLMKNGAGTISLDCLISRSR